jgi:hypothetical protein
MNRKSRNVFALNPHTERGVATDPQTCSNRVPLKSLRDQMSLAMSSVDGSTLQSLRPFESKKCSRAGSAPMCTSSPGRNASSGLATRVSQRRRGSRLESGSSNRNARGSRTIARPRASRWRWPPDSCAGRRSSNEVNPREAAAIAMRRPFAPPRTGSRRFPEGRRAAAAPRRGCSSTHRRARSALMPRTEATKGAFGA